MELQHPTSASRKHTIRGCIRWQQIDPLAGSGRSQSGPYPWPGRYPVAPPLPAVWTVYFHREPWQFHLPIASTQGRETVVGRPDVFERFHLFEVDQRSARDLLQRSLAAEL